MRETAQQFDMQLFYDAFNASPIGIAVENMEGRILFANPALCSMLGFSESEMRNEHCTELSPRDDAEKGCALFQQLRTGSIDHCQLEKRFYRRDGSLFWGRLSLSLLNHGPSRLMLAMVEDITEEKRAQDALRDSEARYRGIVETANEGVWMLDSKLHSSYLNQQMAEMLGYEPAELVGRNPLDFSFPEDVEHQKEALARCQRGRREQFEERLRRKDGTELWVRIAAAPIYKDNGEFDGALAIISDVTERRRAQEAMRESEERFRLVANSAPVMIWMLGPDKRPTYFNHRWLDFTGLSESDLREGLSSIVHPEDYPLCDEIYSRGFDQRQPFRKECRLRRHDGEYRWMLDVGVPRFDPRGNFLGYIGTAIDVTEQKLSEDALSRYAAIVESSDDAISGVDINGTITNWNKGAEILYGFTANEAIGRPISLISPAEGQEIFNKVRSGERIQHYETTRQRKDGTCVDVSLTVSPIINAEGRVVGASGIARDITERKRAEEALKGLSGRLIKAQEEERSRIAREIHDDYQQRLAMLSIDLEALAQRLGTDSETSSQLYGLWNRAGELGLDLHCLSHRLHSSTLDSLGIAAALRSPCAEFNDYHSIAVGFWEHNVPRDIPREVALCLFRIAQEALQNVRKHSSADSAEVRLEGLEQRIHLSVSDKGSGFDPTAALGEGGIGSRSMEERVLLVGGQIAIRSRPMGGTEVDVWAPLNS